MPVFCLIPLCTPDIAMLILASNSPRRRELLRELGYAFAVEPSDFPEKSGLAPDEEALLNARGKAEDVFSRHKGDVVLGADTVVASEGEALGKPKDRADAERMLRRLSGKTHTVYTGVCVLSAHGRRECVAATQVTFASLGEEVLFAYLESGLWQGKAGAYGIQDGYPLVERIEGSYTNVVGLPTEEVGTMLATIHGGTLC